MSSDIPSEKIATLIGDIIAETDKAILFNIDGDEYWFPLSQVYKITRSSNANSDELEVAHWIAKKKGLTK